MHHHASNPSETLRSNMVVMKHRRSALAKKELFKSQVSMKLFSDANRLSAQVWRGHRSDAGRR